MCSPAVRCAASWRASDIAVRLEMGDQLRHSLLGDLVPFGEQAERGPGVVEILSVVEILKGGTVGGAHRRMAVLGEPGEDEQVPCCGPPTTTATVHRRQRTLPVRHRQPDKTRAQRLKKGDDAKCQQPARTGTHRPS